MMELKMTIINLIKNIKETRTMMRREMEDIKKKKDTNVTCTAEKTTISETRNALYGINSR